MAVKKFTAELSKSSIDNLISQLQDYAITLDSRCEMFVKRLADIGVNAAMMTLASKGIGDAERSASFDITYTANGKRVKAVLSVTSEPNVTEDGRIFYPHLAWEFGAGNYYNGDTSPNPKAVDFGMGVGTFPEQTHVPNPGWWYYTDENGDSTRSYGTQATMPMYNASLEMISKIESIAKEVFG